MSRVSFGLEPKGTFKKSGNLCGKCMDDLKNSIMEALNKGKAGDQCDVGEWTQVIYLPVKEE